MIGFVDYGVVRMQLTKVNEVLQRPILSEDRTTYLYTEQSYSFICVFNPAATAYSGVNATTNFPNVSPGAFPGSTTASVTGYLSQPRLKLKVYYYDQNGAAQTLVSSPGPNTVSGGKGDLPCDANNGPVCEVLNIVETYGVRTWIIHCKFTTWINNCNDIGPMLSHRYTMRETIDDLYVPTIITEGVVTFNAGLLGAAFETPDYFRNNFFWRVAGNFRREHIEVQVSSDNTEAYYTTVDKYQYFNLGPNSPAIKIDADLTAGWSRQSLVNTGVNLGGVAANTFATSVSASASAAWGVLTENPGQVFSAGMALLSNQVQFPINAARAGLGAVPQYRANVVVQAWGQPTSARVNLMQMCLAIAYAKLGVTQAFINTTAQHEVIINQKLSEKYVRVDITLSWSQEAILAINVVSINPLGNAIALVFGSSAPFFGSFFPTNEGLNPIVAPSNITYPGPSTGNGAAFTQDSIGNAEPCNFAGAINPWSRSRVNLRYLITGALQSQCQAPYTYTDPNNQLPFPVPPADSVPSPSVPP
jgi:hypothetical protein